MARIIVITGASAGIGKATAELFKQKGDKVYCLQRRKVDGFESMSVDVTDRNAVFSAMEDIYKKEGRIDVLVNNAGFGISGAIEDTTEESAKRLFDVNFFGTVNASQAVLKYMRENGGGTIINISSVAAPLSIPFQAFYSASKAAVSSYTEALRLEVKPQNIKVTSVLPGDVKTDFTAKREKNVVDSAVYGERIQKSVAVMEHDEQNGYPPIVIAKAVYSLSKKKNPPVQKVGGKKYAMFVILAKFLPKNLVNAVVGKLYA
ncbi:MAG: SDR family oxidoreductase [Clostridia bacterium]|nr:SDR family oxidoreductase [Clostridia bacterium]